MVYSHHWNNSGTANAQKGTSTILSRMVTSFRTNFKSSENGQPTGSAAYRQVTETELADWLYLVLTCCRCICDVAAGTAWATSRTNENMRLRQLEPSQSSTAGMPAKLNLSQRRSHAGSKDWDDQCCRPLLFSYRNGIPGSTGGHVAGASAAC